MIKQSTDSFIFMIRDITGGHVSGDVGLHLSGIYPWEFRTVTFFLFMRIKLVICFFSVIFEKKLKSVVRFYCILNIWNNEKTIRYFEFIFFHWLCFDRISSGSITRYLETRVGSADGRTPGELPSLEELKKQITAFAEHLSKLRKAEPIQEYYSGPVLFEDAACQQVFSDNLLNSGGLLAYRKPVNGKPQKTLEDRVGRKIVDSRITIRNYMALNRYNNVPLVGCYEIDAEGGGPEKETVLVENGILKRFLNGRSLH